MLHLQPGRGIHKMWSVLYLFCITGTCTGQAPADASSSERQSLNLQASTTGPETMLPALSPLLPSVSNQLPEARTRPSEVATTTPLLTYEPQRGPSRSLSTVSTLEPPTTTTESAYESRDLDSTATQLMRKAVYWGEIGDPGGLSIDEIMAIAARANPNWGTYEANRAAAQAELTGALLYPNPSIQFEVGRSTACESDEKGRRPTRGTYEIALSQPIELPGKRLARQVEAESGFAVVARERQEFEASLRADVMEAYYTVQYHEALATLFGSLLKVAESFQEVATIRVEVGEAGRIEVVNSRVEVLKAEREMKSSKRRAAAARASLNALTGGCLGAKFRLSNGFPTQLQPFNLNQSIHAALSCHPRLLKLAAELEKRYATLDKERTSWWPDVVLGLTHDQGFDSRGMSASVGMELPLWNRNQGGVARAHADAQKTYNDIVIAFTELRRDVETAWHNLELARDQIASYDNGIKEASEEAFSLAYEQYRYGAAGFFDVLTARRNLQDAEQGYIQALYDASLAKARMERARGQTFGQTTQKTAAKASKRPSRER